MYHLQANGQVEVTNIELENILTKTVSLHKKDWAAQLPKVLWAQRTAWKSTIGFIPFEFLYRKTTVMTIEFEHKTLQTTLDLDIALPTTQ